MIPHLAWSVISTVKTNFIIWKILKIVLLPRNPWQHIAYLKLNQPKIKATKFPQKIVCGNATDTALYISANGNSAETLRKRETRPHFALTCFRPPEMWRKLEPSDFRKISEIRKRLISPCESCGYVPLKKNLYPRTFQCTPGTTSDKTERKTWSISSVPPSRRIINIILVFSLIYLRSPLNHGLQNTRLLLGSRLLII